MIFKNSLAGFGGALLFFLLFHGVDAMAADDLPRVIPYEGVLELDGGSYVGQVHMRVILYDAGMSELWREEYSSHVGNADGPPVDVYGGHFSLLLGEYTPLTAAVFYEPTVSIGFELSDDGASWDVLDGTRQIGSSPYALWSVALAPASVTATEIAANAVQASEIANGAVRASEIPTDAVGHDEIAADAVRANRIAEGAVGTSEIDDGTVTTIDVANDSLTRADFSGEIPLYFGLYSCGNHDDITLDSTCMTELCGTCEFNPGHILNIYHSCGNQCPRDEETCDESENRTSVSCGTRLQGYLLAP